MRLETVSATTQAIERGSRLIGGPLVGLLIALIGPSTVLWIDAATFLFSAALIGIAVPRLGLQAAAEKPKRFHEGLFDGMRFIWNDKMILTLVLTVMITNFLDAPSGAVILPVFAKQQFGSSVDLGLMFAAMGGGSVLGAIAFGAIGPRLPRGTTFAIAFIITGLRFWVLAAFPSLAIILIILILAGMAAGPLNPIISTTMYERIPEHMRGRVFGSVTAGAFIATPFGILLGGFGLEQIGIQWSLIILGVIYLLVTASLTINPEIRAMDRAGFAKRQADAMAPAD